MDLLDSYLERLNRAVERHNAKVAEALDGEEITPDVARQWTLPEGCVTRELVKAGPQSWSKPLRRAVFPLVVTESPDEIVRMCEACPVQTPTIKYLRVGAKKSTGIKMGELRGLPVGIRLMDMAHLVAHSGAGKAVLLG